MQHNVSIGVAVLWAEKSKRRSISRARERLIAGLFARPDWKAKARRPMLSMNRRRFRKSEYSHATGTRCNVPSFRFRRTGGRSGSDTCASPSKGATLFVLFDPG